MATKNIVPRADGEGNLGTTLKRWLGVFISGSLSDGTNSVTVAGLKDAADKKHSNTLDHSNSLDHNGSTQDTAIAGKAALSHAHAEGDVTNLVTDLSGKASISHTHTSLAATGVVTSSGGGLGYATGAGGTVTQLTSRTTGVTLNKLCGNITMFSSAVAAQGVSTFTLTNSFIAATDFIAINHISTTNGGAWNCSWVAAAGSVAITVRNVSNASITQATPLRFVVIKSVTS